MILDILFRSKDVEKEGSGFKRTNQLLEENGLKWTFNKDRFGFYFTFIMPVAISIGANGVNRGVNGVNHGVNDEFTENEAQVYDLLLNNPKLTIENISNLTGKSVRTVQRILTSLVNKGFIIRIGKTKGYWEVIS